MTGSRFDARYTVERRNGSTLAVRTIEESSGGFWIERAIPGDWIETPDGYRPTLRAWRREWLPAREIRQVIDHHDTAAR